MWLAIVYIVYLAVSYFLLITRNLNNDEFDYRSFTTNHFLQLGAIPTILLIIFISLLINFLYRQHRIDKITNYLDKYNPKVSLINWLPTLFIVTDERVNDLELIQYDIIAGKGYLNNFSTFFKYKNRRII